MITAKHVAAFIILTVALLSCMPQQAAIEYSDYYDETDNSNRAVATTGDAMNTQDVLGSLSQMLGAPDQYDVLTAMNVRFIRDLDELNESIYDRYTLRVADNMPMQENPKGSLPMRLQVEGVLLEYPHGFIALNKQDKMIAVASDRLEAQALAQKAPRVFYVLQGETLQTTVARWSKQANWKMYWVIERDYNMVAPAVVFGEFSMEGGALDQLLGTLRNLDQPLRAQFMRNNVVVIRDNTFDSSIMAVVP